jgi:hypothetical protein
MNRFACTLVTLGSAATMLVTQAAVGQRITSGQRVLHPTVRLQLGFQYLPE